MNIGEAAKISGVSAKMIRHYESTNLIKSKYRSSSGYRIYTQEDINELKFIKAARGLGFSQEQIKRLLSLWQDQERASSEVKRFALDHVAELDIKINELIQMRDALKKLAADCHGDHRPECPILNTLESK